MFKIKELRAITENSEVSSIPFKDGLNIVCGPSNTGKTLILECIDFIFGRETTLNDLFKIKVVEIDVETEAGDVTFSRENLQNAKLLVNSNNARIPSGSYSPQGKPSSSEILLKLLGIDEKIEIFKTLTWATSPLNFRSLTNTFMLQEDDIRNKKSALLPTQNAAETKTKSALLYLLTGKNFIGADRETPDEQRQRKKILEKYLTDEIEKLNKEIGALEEKTKPDKELLNKPFGDVEIKINNLNELLNSLTYESSDIASKIMELDGKITEATNLSNKYDVLLSQYESDIRRMQLIIDGEDNLTDEREVVHCPFCNNEMPLEHNSSCSEAAEKEIEKILIQVKDLQEAKKEIANELSGLIESKNKLLDKKADLEKRITDLKADLNDLNKELSKYHKAIENVAKLNELNDRLQSYIAKRGAIVQEKVDTSRLDQKKLFDSDFLININTKVDKILRVSKYENYKNSYFDINSFDLVVNGQAKQYEGEGFRGFLNSALSLAFNEYLMERGVFKAGILMLDSPILSLKEKVEKPIGQSMREGLFGCFLKNPSNLQIIVIENEIPETLDYSKANVIRFTKNDTGRYGFIKNYK